ncbi:hypothetical protein SISNIDRAFT_34796 [Sistotremastrum niveocremeum HHB9708]|uniref:Uncharacterized protein n=1 Tax=Sistotremastrum niveocremeum HHB9708 TaxID=1314777 RepID=A0A164WAM2_9AGAM|nr:hypothetical protein SISNIDRAFT_34796 [Sistotremastrum niveocremeum HHB9708]
MVILRPAFDAVYIVWYLTQYLLSILRIRLVALQADHWQIHSHAACRLQLEQFTQRWYVIRTCRSTWLLGFRYVCFTVWC